jgi:prepilin-type N-terminal cleavage/methylation domain-containing protein
MYKAKSIDLQNTNCESSKSQGGFTIIELLIATAVFAMVLVLIMVGVLQISRTYISGYVQVQTQNTARSILAMITQDIQLNSYTQITPTKSGKDYFCIGQHLYSFVLNQQLESTTTASTTDHALILASGPGLCPSAASTVLHGPVGGKYGTQELLNKNMLLGQLSVTQVPFNPSLFNVVITVAYGNSGVGGILKGIAPNYSCPPLNLGGEFCAVTTLRTTVGTRLGVQ